MEKEQKKLLLVAVSVGVFLLVTITVAIVILTPKIQEAAYYTSIPFQPAVNAQPSENTNNPTQSGTNNNQETTSNSDSENKITTNADSNDGNNLTIQITKPSAAAVPDTVETTTVSKPAAAAEPAKTTVVQSTPAPQPASKSTASSTTQKPATAVSKTINDYWVQTGSFNAKVRADDAKEFLASKGFTTIIENREINGKTWYRVRLGPYTSEKEANYWLALVKNIDGFDESWVHQTIRQQ